LLLAAYTTVILRAARERGVSKDARGHYRLRPILRGSPLCGEHLRTTVEYGAKKVSP